MIKIQSSHCNYKALCDLTPILLFLPHDIPVSQIFLLFLAISPTHQADLELPHLWFPLNGILSCQSILNLMLSYIQILMQMLSLHGKLPWPLLSKSNFLTNPSNSHSILIPVFQSSHHIIQYFLFTSVFPCHPSPSECQLHDSCIPIPQICAQYIFGTQ